MLSNVEKREAANLNQMCICVYVYAAALCTARSCYDVVYIIKNPSLHYTTCGIWVKGKRKRDMRCWGKVVRIECIICDKEDV